VAVLFREGASSSEQRKDTSESNKKTSKEEKTRDEHWKSTEFNLDEKSARISAENDRPHSGEKHDDAWELGTGTNYSINQVYEMFQEKFGVDKLHIPDQKGNYRVTLRENNDTLERLGWEPKDRLKNYIQNL
jgi:hypothetical protein